MPAHLVDGFVASEIQRKITAALYLIEQLFADVADNVAEGIDKNHATPQAVSLHNGLHERPVDHLVNGVADVGKFPSFCQDASRLSEDIGEREIDRKSTRLNSS